MFKDLICPRWAAIPRIRDAMINKLVIREADQNLGHGNNLILIWSIKLKKLLYLEVIISKENNI